MQARVFFATITGNNEDVADVIVDTFKNESVDVTKEDIQLIDPQDISSTDTDIVVVVPYTFDKGSLPDEALDFYEDLVDTDLSGIVYGVSGSGDDFYGDDFAVAIDKFEQQFEKTGATKGAKGVKVNLSPDAAATEALQTFTKQLIVTAKQQEK
ncbi:flavodoxin domain-containing protein [Weissella paramesenteroides]|jgi:flavodoxin short chain|uniref:Flavodoxin n=2 Tax=Weissella paramesenteroides TaxID=1249 RepID=A0ABD4XIB7_WEIPA|nr:flavodoxin domain-containing protein [Weissella paramesenteroides]ATF40789.1 flavodoxin [Weissella paramesenteroides]EER75417.1 putative flavodoxin [Weissella paramesenteroides ATCC 33313]KAA8445536.1 flavodoxin [Weissella paramesenteroides]KAA8451037.1 flavodoxin [Weissella paramesenteroides]KAA8455113.1 flavodoxin [Weissella paramesenteroides]